MSISLASRPVGATAPASSSRSAQAERVLARHNVHIGGNADSPCTLVFAHGFGCDQNVWRHLAPAFAGRYRIALLDYAGCGEAAEGSYDRKRHASLQGHADDLIAVCEAAELPRPILVAHSVSAMIGALVARRRPQLLHGLVMVCPTPSFMNDGAYRGGFDRDDIEDLLETLDKNHFSWSRMMAPIIMGNADQPELAEDLGNSFCRFDPAVARHFARTTFLSDHRDDLAHVHVPTLVLQCQDDALASLAIGDHVQAALPDSRLVVMQAKGHCPHLSAPTETIAALEPFLASRVEALTRDFA